MKRLIAVLCISVVSISVWHCKKDNNSPTDPSVDTHPDLIVSISPSSTNVEPSEMITLTATLSNTGTEMADPTVLRWYRSTDTNIDTNDTQVGTNAFSNLEVGGSSNVSISITVPNTVGTYYYGAGVDRVRGESDTNNNASSAVRVLVILGTYLATSDFSTLNAAGNHTPVSIWSEGSTMWVADWSDAKLYAYDLATKARNINEDFSTLSGAGNTAPSGIWSDGITMWVADNQDDKLYAYSLATKAHVPAKDFNTLSGAGNTVPSGIWSDGTTLWVADTSDAKLYAYDMRTKAHKTNEDFSTLSAAGNRDPRGIWSDGTTLWVADTSDAKLYAYSLATKERVPTKDFNTLSGAGNTAPSGIWSEGTTTWVADTSDDKLYAYDARELINTNSLSSVLMRVAEIATAPDLMVSTLSASTNTVTPSDTITLTAIVSNMGASPSTADHPELVSFNGYHHRYKRHSARKQCSQ